ncbi:LPS export ABC transporter periplasmic protein LptC [Agrobacterium vitis]|uniref:LPS export ABC transporter periplasmic protein LptC n=1 Tax=Agrobacterium vitis TaxID=373 RepID=A0ABD6G5U9_AGRVI|nr:LPS export ABC transporter periplasmic protein LptC [Agrobacterium vitis]MUO79884.1 LPS export ABC transporter periplasmic protein LptC [Agrobacterium vitis]MUO93627.1 LPS export ABC transporter periplasmic protein LptC [Agrobacterium vitis]MUP04122.1 LPS export ABC transporter periplasmic protein LptC [Agrobacterium vitis]MUZ83116.1 LPS export ABC transporter periplasmic protein LptC [Agrobacterium vitis]MVA11045.1 LPS export ABC transporter periplasmic protein LptC [Agrobacterium vitis]
MLKRLDKGALEPRPPAPDTSYRKAVGHSHRVRRLRIALPALAVVLSLGFVAVSVVRAYLPDNIKIEGAKIEDGKVVMAKPAISGRNSNGAPYSMNAVRALQDIKNPNLITLETITATMPVNDDTSADIKAQRGTYDRSSDKMVLDRPFTIHLSSGVDAEFQSADLDVKAGKLKTNQPVSIKTKDSSIVAQSMDMTDKGQTITLTGAVRLNIAPTALQKPGN